MNTSIDGRTWGSRWRPAENRMAGLFERIHEQLGSGSWLIGRVTGSEYARADAYPDHPAEVFPREPWFVRRDASRTGTRSTCCGSNDGTCRDQTADGCPAEPAASRRARQAGVAGHGFCGHAWAATAPRGPSVDVSERQMGLRRLGTESSPDSPLEGDGFEPSAPQKKPTLLAARARSSNSPSARKTGSFVPGPRVRIHLPPAASRVRT
jgi:hypothetical protein